MSSTKHGRGHYDGDGCTFPTPGHLVHTCDEPCHYGGLSAARKYSASELGHMGHCNRIVKNQGDRCYKHSDVKHERQDVAKDA